MYSTALTDSVLIDIPVRIMFNKFSRSLTRSKYSSCFVCLFFFTLNLLSAVTANHRSWQILLFFFIIKGDLVFGMKLKYLFLISNSRQFCFYHFLWHVLVRQNGKILVTWKIPNRSPITSTHIYTCTLSVLVATCTYVDYCFMSLLIFNIFYFPSSVKSFHVILYCYL